MSNQEQMLEIVKRLNANSTYGAFGPPPKIQYDNLLIYPKGCLGDKNDCLELTTHNEQIIDEIATIVLYDIRYETDWRKFKDLNLFMQGKSKTWILIESWSDDQDLFLEVCMKVAETVNLPLDFCK